MARNSYLHVGDILAPHGLKGTISIYSHTRPADAVAGYSCWWLGESAEVATPFTLQRCWQHGKRMLATLEGVNDCDQAGRLKGLKIWIPADDVVVEDDEYLWEELIGCAVVHGDEHLGTVTALEAYGAQDNLVVVSDADASRQGEWLIPFTEAVVVAVDLDQQRIEVALPEGMDACFTPKF